MRECGTCTACCTLLGVPEIEKPQFSPCPHCTGHNCGIYESRPQLCRQFLCVWLSSDPEAAASAGLSVESGEDRLRMRLPGALRPDKSHCVLMLPDESEALVVVVDPAFRNAWKVGPMSIFLDSVLLRSGWYIVQIEKEMFAMVGARDSRGRLIQKRAPIVNGKIDRSAL